MLVDYWLAASYGCTWLTIRRVLRLQSARTDLPALCRRVAHGEALPAGELRKAQDFATAMWWRSAIAAIVPFGIIAVSANGLVHGAASDVIVGLLLALGFYAGLATLQAVMAFCRSGFHQGYVRRACPEAWGQPLPQGELGLPRRWDFWAVLAAGATVCAILGYAGLHNAPH